MLTDLLGWVPPEGRAIAVIAVCVLAGGTVGYFLRSGRVGFIVALVLLAMIWPVAKVGFADAAHSLRSLRAEAMTLDDASAPLPAVEVSGEGCPGAQLEDILLTIRTRESGNNYEAQNPHATASGAYQFIDATWQALGGSGSAKHAPAHEQDQRAAVHVQQILTATGGAVEMVPASWYVGIGGARSLPWDQVPKPDQGNTLTIREYVDKWLTTCRNAVAKRTGVQL